MQRLIIVTFLFIVACGPDYRPGPGDGGNATTSTSGSTSASAGGTATSLPSERCESTGDACVIGYCPGRCSAPRAPDGDGSCEPDAGCEPSCFLNSDCPSSIGSACHTVRCDPTGKTTAPTSPLKGCYIAETTGGACNYPAGGDGVCIKGECILP